MIDVGPGAGEEGGHIVAEGPPESVSRQGKGVTAPFLKRMLGGG
jgi:excinuclease ABC subunit A